MGVLDDCPGFLVLKVCEIIAVLPLLEAGFDEVVEVVDRFKAVEAVGGRVGNRSFSSSFLDGSRFGYFLKGEPL
jgi:hypothetical protein